MVEYDLLLGDYDIKIVPIKVKAQKLTDVDREGNELKKVYVSKAESHFENSKGEIIEQVYKLNPQTKKPMKKLERTKRVKVYNEVDMKEVKDLFGELHYGIKCKDLLQDLKTKKKALRFVFSNGNGFKVYIAYIYLEYGKLFMSCGRLYKSKIEITDDTETLEVEDNVERASAEEMLAMATA